MKAPVTTLAALTQGMLAEQTSAAVTEVAGITLDSRQVNTGYVFVALAKQHEQRQRHIEQAITLGCNSLLIDADMPLNDDEQNLIAPQNIAVVAVVNLEKNTGEIAARFYGHPSKNMTVLAVTGTNGKTSVSQFIAQSLESLGYATGVIGTLGMGRIDALITTGMTTPDPISVQAVLADFIAQGISHVVLEASSHALEQGRLNSVNIDVAILTNLSRDHLDYHKTMQAYGLAKQRLFEFNSLSSAVINTADEFGVSLLDVLVSKSISTYRYNSQNNNTNDTIRSTDINCHRSGIEFTLTYADKQYQIASKLLGRFNVDNLLAAFCGLVAMGIADQQAAEAIMHCHSVDGRMQSFSSESTAELVIDFAHTPDALSQALQSLRVHLPTSGALWCVFGCGGDRDKGKRPLMGAVAQQLADHIVITADNPRSESNQDIVNDILNGINAQENIYVEHDREAAILYAVRHATQQDIVLIAGKGHEDYQEVNGQKLSYSDIKVVTRALSAANDDSHDIAEVK